MNEILDKIRDVLTSFEASASRFAESEIANRILALHSKSDDSPQPLELVAEVLAFHFSENYKGEDPDWGTYYGPLMTGKTKAGATVCVPDIRQVTPEVISYWQRRAMESTHPILRSRYSDLVWDLSRKAAGSPPNVVFAQSAVDANVAIAKTNAHRSEVATIEKLRRALSLALSINDLTRRDQVRAAVIEYELAMAEDDKAGLWGFSFDILLNPRLFSLTAEEESAIIGRLEERLSRLVHPVDEARRNPWAAEEAATRLATYYRKANRIADVERVLRMAGDAYVQMSNGASGMLAHSWLQKVHGLYTTFGLQEAADEIALALRAVGPKALSEMKPIQANFEVTEQQLREYVNALIGGDLRTALARIALHHVERRSTVESQVRDLAAKAPISYLFSTNIQDHEGRTVASIGPLEADLPGHVVNQMSQNMSFTSVFLREVLRSLYEAHRPSPDLLADYVLESPVFGEDRREILVRALSAHQAEDFLGFIHMIVPQLEHAFRSLVEKSGGAVLKPGRSGGFNLKMLDELLREDAIEHAFGEEEALYFRVLLTDQRGWNVRNNVCHGILPAAAFSSAVADRLLHVVLCLALLREKTR